MTDLLAQIMHTTDSRDFPRVAAVDHVAVAGVTYADLVAHYASHDDDDRREIADEERDF